MRKQFVSKQKVDRGMADDTSIANLSSLRRSNQTTGVMMHPELGSFRDVQVGEPEQAMMDSEYGMPITEEAENINTMQQN